ncbi:hypothetical protein [Herbidospora daliensis]|uniref:hypothetical protein n=1 Tax=Herbidospora daliensis TaxID=295585 RepID=UPI000B328FB0|nr:hypothetical protein [Herbidospora daliensis]
MMRAAGALVGLTLLVAATGCGDDPPVARPAVTPAPTVEALPVEALPERPSEELALPDGRRVAMRYESGRGLFEQHFDPKTGAWSRSRLVYKTKTDPCQSIKLQEKSGTVTAIANFGRYCSDGEPPTESIAAVAVEDLSEWRHHLTRKFDGWARAAVSDGGRKVTFVRNATHVRARLVWTASEGFSDTVFTFTS